MQNGTSQRMLEFFHSVHLLEDVDERALQSLVYSCITKKVDEDQILFFQDEPGESVFVVQTGKIAIVLTTPDGRELVINEMLPGDVFGDIAAILGQPRSASAVAREPSKVIVLPYEKFMGLLENEPKLMRHLIELLAERLRDASERESALAFLAAPVRLARTLIQLSEQQNKPGGLVAVSQDELAHHIGVTRQTIAKILKQWREAGWIITGRGKIMLVDWNPLRGLAKGA